MKNIFILSVSIIISLFISEGIIRYFSYLLPIDITGVPTDISSRGYTLNPDHGIGRHQIGQRIVYYHYSPPHLRDTIIDKRAIPILVLGDSFTFGWLLPRKATYLHHLQRFADKTFDQGQFQFLNAATGGWGTADYLAYLEEYGEQSHPKMVIVFLNTDDIGRSIKRNLYKLNSDHPEILIDNFHPIPHEKIKKLIYGTTLFQHSILLHFLRYELSGLINRVSEQSANIAITNNHIIPVSQQLQVSKTDSIQLSEALFDRLNAWCKRHQAKLVVITTGFNAFYPITIKDPTYFFMSDATRYFDRNNIPYKNNAIELKAATDGQIIQFPGDQHPNEKGALIIATISWPFIKKQLKSLSKQE